MKPAREVAFRLANAPTSWGIEAPLKPTYPSWRRVLDEAARAGYEGIELGPYGFFPVEPDTLGAALAEHRLQLIAGTVMETFEIAEEAARISAVAERTCALLASQGADFVVIIFGISASREATAGRSDDAIRLDPKQLETSMNAISAVAATAHKHGLTPVLHPHAGTYLEFLDEIELLAQLADVQFCVDTGHAAYAGIDPPELIDSLGERIAYVHLKDLSPDVLDAARQRRWGFWEAYERGIFTILGRGLVDFGRVFGALKGCAYDGWLTVEQDEMPGSRATPFDNAVANRRFLASIEERLAR